MPLTSRQIANVLARGIGIYTFDPSAAINPLNQQAMSSNDLDDFVDCINGGLQEVYTESTLAEVGQRLSGTLFAPVTLAVYPNSSPPNSYSNEIIILTGFLPWMLGCSIGIAGDTRDNQFVSGGSVIQSGISISSGGTGYTSAPSVAFQGGDGNATGFVTIGGGAITGVTVTSGGNGYLPARAVFTGGGGSGAVVNVTPSNIFNLLRPYMGAASESSTNATVWCDAIAQPTTIARLLGPVAIPNIPALSQCSTEEEFNGYFGWPGPLGIIGWASCSTYGNGNSYTTINKPVGQPVMWFGDKQTGVTPYAPPQLYLRVSPKPAIAIPITYGVRLKPYQVTAADIWNSNSPNVDPWTATGQSFPLDVLESTLLPICLFRWMSSGHFEPSDKEAKAIEANYHTARKVIMPLQNAAVGPTRVMIGDAAYCGTFAGFPYGRSGC